MVSLELTEVHVEAVVLAEPGGGRSLVILTTPEWAEAIAHLTQGAPASFPEPGPVPQGAVVTAVQIAGYAGAGLFTARIGYTASDGAHDWIQCPAAVAVAVATQRGIAVEASDEVLGGLRGEPRYRDGMYDEPFNLDFADGLRFWHGHLPYHEAVARPAGSAILRTRDDASAEAELTATLAQCCRPGSFRSAHVRMSAQLRTTDAERGADIWVRVYSPSGLWSLYGPKYALSGSQDWVHREIVFVVPESAWKICYGVRLDGRGAVEMAGVAFDVLGPARRKMEVNLLHSTASELTARGWR